MLLSTLFQSMNLKIHLILYFIITCFLSCGSIEKDKEHVLRPGIGIDSISVSKVTLDYVISRYGHNYSTDTFYLHPPAERELYSIQVSYDTLGISFFFRSDMNSTICVSYQIPFQGKTDKGIVLGKSSFKDVEKVYGETNWEYVTDDFGHVKEISKPYNGIRFNAKINVLGRISYEQYKEYLDTVITEINIVELKESNKSTGR
jgi:hypothetical protein